MLTYFTFIQENARIQESLQFREQQLRGLEQKLTSAEQSVEILKGQLYEFQAQTEQNNREVSVFLICLNVYIKDSFYSTFLRSKLNNHHNK